MNELYVFPGRGMGNLWTCKREADNSADAMNDRQRNRLRMYKATRAYLNENETAWNGIAANVDALTNLTDRITAIDTKVTAQEAELGGYTQNKYQLRETLNTNILLVAGGTAVFARATNNPILLADVDLEPSQVARASDQVVDDIAARVQAAADSELASLSAYGIDAAEMAALGNAITAHENAKAMPDAKRAQRTGHTETLEPMFRETSLFLDGQLDVLMRRYKATAPTFHAGYEAARVIIDLHGPGDPEEPEPVPDPVPEP